MIIRSLLMLTFLVGTAAYAKVPAQKSVVSNLKYDSNVDPKVQKQMEDDLSFVSQINGSKTTPLFSQIFGKLEGSSLQNWFNSRIQNVGYATDDSGAVAYVMIFQPHKMWLTQNFVQFQHPQISRLMIVYHEARHSETMHGNWPHDTCPTPFKNDKGEDMKSIWTGLLLEGQPACDSTPLGSYGSSTILLKNVALNCESCSEKVKMDADIYATDQLGRINNSSAKQEMLKDFGVAKQ